MKIEKKHLWPSLIVTAIYAVILGACGLFGETVASVIRFAAPYFFALLGLLLSILIPYRVMTALQRRQEIREKIEAEKRIARQHEMNKKLKGEAKKYENLNELY